MRPGNSLHAPTARRYAVTSESLRCSVAYFYRQRGRGTQAVDTPREMAELVDDRSIILDHRAIYGTRKWTTVHEILDKGGCETLFDDCVNELHVIPKRDFRLGITLVYSQVIGHL